MTLLLKVIIRSVCLLSLLTLLGCTHLMAVRHPIVDSISNTPEEVTLNETPLPVQGTSDSAKNVATDLAILIQRDATQFPNPFPNQNPFLCRETVCILEHLSLYQRPIGKDGRYWIDPTYPYGSDAGGLYAPHHGVEFYNVSETPVLAAADGLVIVASNDQKQMYAEYVDFYGNLVILEHNLVGYGVPVYTLYGHLSKINVTEGQFVTAGEYIGAVGMTGSAIGSHLHFEVRLGANDYDHTVNPVLWLQPRLTEQGKAMGTLAGLVINQNDWIPLNLNLTLQTLGENGTSNGKDYYFSTYADPALQKNALFHENFVLADLPPGDYRLSLVAGTLFEQVVTIEAGKISYTIVTIP